MSFLGRFVLWLAKNKFTLIDPTQPTNYENYCKTTAFHVSFSCYGESFKQKQRPRHQQSNDSTSKTIKYLNYIDKPQSSN